MNLLDWLFQWEPVQPECFLCFHREAIFRLTLNQIAAADPGEEVEFYGALIAFCDGPEGPTRGA